MIHWDNAWHAAILGFIFYMIVKSPKTKGDTVELMVCLALFCGMVWQLWGVVTWQ